MTLRERLKSADVHLAVLALAAFAIRARPLIGRGGPWGFPVDYDEGVYFSAAGLLVRGVLPWRDFVFVHPPGVLLGWAPFAAFDVVRGFEVARFAACALGAANVFLLGQVVKLRVGHAAAVAAALLYATYPEAIGTERGPFIEPWLNLFVLLAGWCALKSRWAWAGALLGVAVWMKLWALLWFPAFAILWWREKSVRGLVALAVALVPLLALLPTPFWDQVIAFQLARPPDATQGLVQRLVEIFSWPHAGLVVLCLIGVRERFFAIATVMIVAAFLGAAAYWSQYNAHLALAQCGLAGAGFAALERFRWRWAVLAAAVWLAVQVPWPARTRDLLELRGVLAAQPKCWFAFEPAWSLAAGELPAHGDGAAVIVDSYGAMLLAAGKGFATTQAALRSPAAQAYVAPRLAACPTIVMGWRGEWQLSDETKAALRQARARVEAAPFEVLQRAAGSTTE